MTTKKKGATKRKPRGGAATAKAACGLHHSVFSATALRNFGAVALA